MRSSILITSIGGIRGRDLALKLKRGLKGTKVFTGDKNFQENMEFFSDGFFQLKDTNQNKKYISHLLKIVKEKKIQLIIPGSDDEAILMSKYKKKIFKAGSKVSIVDYKVLKKFKDKFNTYKELTQNKIFNIYWEKIRSATELKIKIKKKLSSIDSVVIKPVYSRGGRDITIVENKNIKTKNFNDNKEIAVSKKNFLNKYIKIYKGKFPLIMMEKLKGPPYDVDILSWKGKLIKCVVRKRIGFQGINGNVILKDNKKFINYIKKIVKCFNLSWLYDCDLMLDKKNNPVIIELNPRISGSISSSLSAGIPLFSDLLKLSKEKFSSIKSSKIKSSKIVKSFYNSIL